MTEKELLEQVRQLALMFGIKCYHTHDSRKSEPGFPDVVLVGTSTEFWELKVGTGRVTDAQRAWIDAIKASGVYAGVFRPADWDIIVKRMQHIRPN